MNLLSKPANSKVDRDKAFVKFQENEVLDKTLALKAAHLALSNAEMNSWLNCRYTFKCTVNYNKIFVISKLVDDTPQILGVLRILEPSLTHTEGYSVQVSLEIGGLPTAEFSIGHEPIPIFEDKVFCHVPFIVTAFYTPHYATNKFVLRVPMVFKTEAKPWDSGEGVRMLPLPEFRDKYPEYRNFTA